MASATSVERSLGSTSDKPDARRGARPTMNARLKIDLPTADSTALLSDVSAATLPSPHRVLYIVSAFPCWSETFIVREIRTLIEDGVDVRILSLKHSPEGLVQTDAAALLSRLKTPQNARTA